MLIKSFLAIPVPGKFNVLKDEINNFSNCEVTSPEKGQQALVVVMEHRNQEDEDQFLLKLHELESLRHLNLVSSFNAT